jgi:hypothetical protein
MIKLKRDYQAFKALVLDKSLQIFIGEIRADFYNLLAVDGPVTYECNIVKDGNLDQLDYEANLAGNVTSKISVSPDWDDFLVSFPTNITELHTYKANGVTVQTVLVTYVNASKNTILRVQKTRV